MKGRREGWKGSQDLSLSLSLSLSFYLSLYVRACAIVRGEGFDGQRVISM